ncbi:MAG: ATP-binding protein, partial [Bacteroidota bacterium]
IGSIGIHLDITKQKKLVDENAFKDTRIKKLFDISLDALISINDKGEIFEWSPQAEKIFGYSKDEILGKRLSDTIIPHQHRSAHDSGMSNYMKTGEGPVLNKRIEITALRKTGEEFPIELTIFPLSYDGQHFFTAFARDITELKESRVNMEKALARQKELNELRSKFISMMSHELRTPLTTIKTNTEIVGYLLKESGEINRPQLLKNIDRIDGNVERLNLLISNILTIGKLEASKVNYSPQLRDAESLIVQSILPNLPSSRVPTFSLNGDKYDLMLDDKLFVHILNNLIENAFKYSPNGIKPELHLEYEQAGLFISVKDYGIGIPEEDQKELFNTFYRASNVDNIQGTGLGLTIVKECVELHNGKISVESDINKGTIFTIFLPKEL